MNFKKRKLLGFLLDRFLDSAHAVLEWADRMFMGTYIVFNKNKYNNGNISKETIFKNQERKQRKEGKEEERERKEGRKKDGEKQTNE